jgi:hypothetical protein
VTINKCLSGLISSISPMLNPFIYTLRNKQVKQASQDLIKKIAFLLKKWSVPKLINQSTISLNFSLQIVKPPFRSLPAPG